MKIWFGLRIKFTALFLVFALVMTGTVGAMTYYMFKQSMLAQYGMRAVGIAKLAADAVNGDRVGEYSETLQKDEAYEETQEQLNQIKRLTDVSFLYVIRRTGERTSIYLWDTWDLSGKQDTTSELGTAGVYDPEFVSVQEVMSTGEATKTYDISKDETYGYLLSVYAPVKDSAGEIVALAGVDVDMNSALQNISQAVYPLLASVVGIILLCFLVLLFLVQRGIISPIRQLKEKVQEMGEGRLGVQIPIRSRDEIGEISRVFNQMSLNIEGNIKEVTAINDGYYKFVPSKILKLLHKNHIEQVQLGNQEAVSMEVTSMQINQFDRLTHSMDSKQLFEFINQVYTLLIPSVLDKDGVVERYTHEGFVAIYDKVGGAALDSAIGACQKLNEWKRNHPNMFPAGMEIAFGIGQGNVMLGVVGHDKRLAAIAIAEQIDIVNHLKSVGERYRSRILVTESAAARIGEFQTQYHVRLLGLISIGAERRAEKLYDVYDGDEPQERALKDATRDCFEEGVSLFLEKRFPEARRCFIEVLKQYNMDYAARRYLYLCNQYYSMAGEGPDAMIYIEQLKSGEE